MKDPTLALLLVSSFSVSDLLICRSFRATEAFSSLAFSCSTSAADVLSVVSASTCQNNSNSREHSHISI